MKKLAKYLALFMVLAVIVSALAVAAFADEPTAQSDGTTVGSYTAPETAYVPGDDVYYAIWATEDDFLNNGAPTAEVKSEELVTTDIGTSGYLHVFKDVKIKTRFTASSSLVICLGGKTLTVDVGDGFQSGAKPVTIKDGYLITATGNGLRPHNASTIWTFDNVAWTVKNGTTLYGTFAKEINFIDSKLIFENDARFYLNKSGSAGHTISFKNTDIELNKSVTRLFHIISGASYNISFDRNSSIKLGTGGNLVNWFDPENGTATINFELGFTLDSALELPVGTDAITVNVVDADGNPLDSNSYYVRETLDGGFVKKDSLAGYRVVELDGNIAYFATAEATFSSADITDSSKLVVLDPATGEPETDTVYLIPGEGNYTVTTDLSAYGAVDIDPETNIVYQTWEKGADATTLPTGTYSDTVGFRDGSYILLLQDAIIPAEASTYREMDITFDLNGKKLTFAGKFTFGNSYSGALTRDVHFVSSNGRGTLDFGSAQITCRDGTNLYFENLNIKNSRSNFMFFDNTSQIAYFKDCDITTAGYLFQTYGGQKATVYKLRVFDNCKITCAGIQQIQGSIGNDKIQISLTNGCVYDSTGPMLHIYGNAACATDLSGSRSVNVETSTKFKGAINLVQIDSGYESHAATIESNLYDDISASLLPGAYLGDGDAGASSGKVSVTLGNVADEANLINIKDGEYFTLHDKNNLGSLDLAYTISMPGETPTGYIAEYIEYNSANVATLTNAAISSIPSGATITFYQNLIYTPDTTTSSDGRVQGYKDNLTFDFNTYTFYINNRWQIGSDYSTCEKILFKNGKIIGGNSSGDIFYGTPGKFTDLVYSFDKVDITATKNGAFYFYGGTIKMTGGSLSAPSTTAIKFVGAVDDHFLSMDGVTVNTGTLIEKTYAAGKSDIYDIKNSILNLTYNVLYVGGSNPSATDKITVNIANSDVTGTLYGGLETAAFNYTTYNITNSTFSKKPTVTAGVAFVYATGEAMFGVVEGETVIYKVATKPTVDVDLQANLTLTADFNVNFFTAEGSNILGIYRGNTLLENSEWDGMTKYVLPLTVEEAADAVALEIKVVSGENTYLLPLNYSVLAYAEKLVASEESEAAKNVVKAAVAYINAAYAYVEKTAPAALTDFVTANAVEAQTAVGTLPSGEDVPAAIAGMNLLLADETHLILTIDETFEGTVTVNGVAYTFEAAEGQYIKIDVKAKDLLKPITVTDGEKTAELTLAGYANSAEVAADAGMKALVDALYTYATYAAAYAAN